MPWVRRSVTENKDINGVPVTTVYVELGGTHPRDWRSKQVPFGQDYGAFLTREMPKVDNWQSCGEPHLDVPPPLC